MKTNFSQEIEKEMLLGRERDRRENDTEKEYRHSLEILRVRFQIAAMKGLTRVHAKVMFTLYCSLLSEK
jgi:hypothetical protein